MPVTTTSLVPLRVPVMGAGGDQGAECKITLTTTQQPDTHSQGGSPGEGRAFPPASVSLLIRRSPANCPTPPLLLVFLNPAYPS